MLRYGRTSLIRSMRLCRSTQLALSMVRPDRSMCSEWGWLPPTRSKKSELERGVGAPVLLLELRSVGSARGEAEGKPTAGSGAVRSRGPASAPPGKRPYGGSGPGLTARGPRPLQAPNGPACSARPALAVPARPRMPKRPAAGSGLRALALALGRLRPRSGRGPSPRP